MLRLTSLVAISLFIHFLMYEGVWLLPAIPRLSTSETEIEVIDEATPQNEKKLDKAVVKNVKLPESKLKAKEMTDPVQFMAEQKQRFEEQTRAKKLGAFENRIPSAGQHNKNLAAKPAGTKNPASNDGDTPEFAREMQQQMARVQESTVPYELPREIQSGSATNLNADAHVYASFYNRVVSLFYPRWSDRLDAIFERLPSDIRKELAGKAWTTEVEIWLTAEGLYEKGVIMTSSGFPPFDEAGIIAFRNAKFFPNPPRSKVQADGGRVRLRYRIRVNVY